MNLARLRRAAVAVIGFTVVLIGVAMMVLPGPAIVVIPLGLAILATEFVWARRLLEKARATIARKESAKTKPATVADDAESESKNRNGKDESKCLPRPE